MVRGCTLDGIAIENQHGSSSAKTRSFLAKGTINTAEHAIYMQMSIAGRNTQDFMNTPAIVWLISRGSLCPRFSMARCWSHLASLPCRRAITYAAERLPQYSRYDPLAWASPDPLPRIYIRSVRCY